MCYWVYVISEIPTHKIYPNPVWLHSSIEYSYQIVKLQFPLKAAYPLLRLIVTAI